jgi:hypothetical protein
MNRNTIALVWLGGAVLAALLYLAGPWNVVQNFWLAIENLQYLLGNSLFVLFHQAFDLVHAVAIALFAVFIVLSILASRRGIRGGGVAGITALFVGLVVVGGYNSRLCWLAALIVALVGATHMTQLLLSSRPRSPWTEQGQRHRA